MVYLTFSVLNKLSFITLLYLPHFALSLINGLIAIKRLDKFMGLPEAAESLAKEKRMLFHRASVKISNLRANYGAISDELNIDSPDKKSKKKAKAKSNGVENFSYISDEAKDETLALKRVSFEAKPGELTIVVGPVGSGKSTLLQAILSELEITGGSIEVNGVLSYSSQEAWLFSGTVRENILFGSEFEDRKYREILKVCSLERDLTLWPDGDQTVISEQGW